MNELDTLRWMWAASISQDLVSWAALRAPPDMEIAPGIAAPLTGAWLVARTARVLAEGGHPDPTEAIATAIPFEGGYPSGGEIVRSVESALLSSDRPSEVPEDPHAAELLFSELWSGARRRELGPLALHRELAQRWEIRDPRMLDYLSKLDGSPFGGYVDIYQRLLSQGDSEAVRLLSFVWDKLAPESDIDAYPGMPIHLTELAAAMYTCLRVAHNLKRHAPGLAANFQAPAEAALQLVTAHREHIADVLGGFTAHEVEIIRSAIFGDD